MLPIAQNEIRRISTESIDVSGKNASNTALIRGFPNAIHRAAHFLSSRRKAKRRLPVTKFVAIRFNLIRPKIDPEHARQSQQ
jgi:hypothetical protein